MELLLSIMDWKRVEMFFYFLGVGERMEGVEMILRSLLSL